MLKTYNCEELLFHVCIAFWKHPVSYCIKQDAELEGPSIRSSKNLLRLQAPWGQKCLKSIVNLFIYILHPTVHLKAANSRQIVNTAL